SFVLFFTDQPPSVSSALSLHDALPIFQAFDKASNILNNPHDRLGGKRPVEFLQSARPVVVLDEPQNLESEGARAAIASLDPLCTDRKSTRLNSSHVKISYAVFCLKKKK